MGEYLIEAMQMREDQYEFVLTTTTTSPAPPPLSILLHCLTESGAQQMLPQQHPLPPQPSNAQT